MIWLRSKDFDVRGQSLAQFFFAQWFGQDSIHPDFKALLLDLFH